MDMTITPEPNFKARIIKEQSALTSDREKNIQENALALELEKTKMKEIATLLSTVEPEILASGGSIQKTEDNGIKVFGLKIKFQAERKPDANSVGTTGKPANLLDAVLFTNGPQYLVEFDTLADFTTATGSIPLPGAGLAGNPFRLAIPEKASTDRKDFYKPTPHPVKNEPPGIDRVQDILAKHLARKLKLS